MTHNFEIKVQCKGQAAGSLNWLNSILEDGELVIRNTNNGVPGMFLHSKTKNDGGLNSENEGNKFICKAMVTEVYVDGGYRTKYLDDSKNNVIAYISAIDNHETHGFTEYPLTPAALTKVEEFIDKAVELYTEWWNNQ